jgi:hypothetical protein
MCSNFRCQSLERKMLVPGLVRVIVHVTSQEPLSSPFRVLRFRVQGSGFVGTPHVLA